MSPAILTQKKTTTTDTTTLTQMPATLESSDSKLVYLYLVLWRCLIGAQTSVDSLRVYEAQSTNPGLPPGGSPQR